MNWTRSQNGALIATVVLILIGWVLIAIVHPSGPTRGESVLAVGLLLGTMYGQVSLAAAWSALGPLAFIHRLPLSFTWLGIIGVALAVNLATDRMTSNDEFEVLLYVGAGLVGQWLLVLLPVLLLARNYSLRIGGGNDATSDAHHEHQFGIGQLMFLTAVVAIVLGIGRSALGGLTSEGSRGLRDGLLMFGFFGLSSALIAFPLVAAALIPRQRMLAAFAALVLLAFATVLEVPVFQVIHGSASWDDWVAISATNVVQFAWVLAVVSLLRRGGYRIASRA